MHKDDIQIAKPCDVDWRSMTRVERGRFCGDCRKVVRDLSSMSERDARDLLRTAGGGELCVRYLYDKHGKVFFAGDRLVPASFLVRAKYAAAAAALPLALGCSSPLAASGGDSTHSSLSEVPEYQEAMGGAPAYRTDSPDAADEVDASADASDAAADGADGAALDAEADAGSNSPDGGFDPL